jgi:hypothetical protein
MISATFRNLGPGYNLAMQTEKANHLPSELEFHISFNGFINRWARLSAQHFSLSHEDIAHLPLEQSICFPEPFEGLLVVRSRDDFGKLLCELNEEKTPSDPVKKREYFLEMTVLFWHQLFLDLWRLDTRKLKQALFKNSIPLDWPDRNPQSSFGTLINNIPLEVRLWSDITDGERDFWKRPKR